MAGSAASRPTFGCVIAWIVSPVAPLNGASLAASRKEFSMVPCSSARRGRRSELVSSTVRASIVAVWPLFSGGRHFGDFEDGFLGGDYLSGGHQSGSVDTDDAHTGTRAAKSGSIGNNEVTWMRRTVNGANMSFGYRIGSEAGGDVFTFYRDGNADIQASGAIGWTLYSVSVPPGSHTLLWEYAKDGSATSGRDAVWIDDLEVGADDRIWTDIAPQTAQGATSAPWTPGQSRASFKIRPCVENADGSQGGAGRK